MGVSTLGWICTEMFSRDWETWACWAVACDRRLLVVGSANWVRLWSSTDMGLSSAEGEEEEEDEDRPGQGG